jgi:hypothetical protein
VSSKTLLKNNSLKLIPSKSKILNILFKNIKTITEINVNLSRFFNTPELNNVYIIIEIINNNQAVLVKDNTNEISKTIPEGIRYFLKVLFKE